MDNQMDCKMLPIKRRCPRNYFLDPNYDSSKISQSAMRRWTKSMIISTYIPRK